MSTGETQVFSRGELVDTVEVTPRFEDGDEELVSAGPGYLMNKVIIKRPASGHFGTDHTVTYKSYNGADTLYLKPIMHGDTCGDIVALEFIDTPTKPNTETDVHVFTGWSTEINGAADASAVSNILTDRTVYAAFVAKPGAIIDSGKCGDNLTWTLSETGRLTISGYGPMYDSDYYWSNNHEWDILTVVIEYGATSIGRGSFSGLLELTKIDIPNSVTTIGQEAFGNSSDLKTITIPSSVTTIGSYAFSYAIQNVIFEDTTTWYLDKYTEDDVMINPSDLANPQTAAEYLRSSEYSGTWYKV